MNKKPIFEITIHEDEETGRQIVERHVQLRDLNTKQQRDVIEGILDRTSPEGQVEAVEEQTKTIEAALTKLSEDIPERSEGLLRIARAKSAPTTEFRILCIEEAKMQLQYAATRIERRKQKAGRSKGGRKGAETRQSKLALDYERIRSQYLRLIKDGEKKTYAYAILGEIFQNLHARFPESLNRTTRCKHVSHPGRMVFPFVSMERE